ncbi:hypothetical protein GCM10027162_03490 [Streptomyces incanus]
MTLLRCDPIDERNDQGVADTSVSAMHAHVVFVTKYRRGVFNDAMPTRCEEIMRKVCASFEAELKEFIGEKDHVHLLVHYPPKVAVSKLVNSLKGVPARRIRLGAPPGRRLGESSPAGSTAPSCTGTCVRPQASPHRAEGRRWRSSISTSSSNNVRSKVHVREVLRCVSSPA